MEYVAYFQDQQYLVVHYCRLFDYSYFADNNNDNNNNNNNNNDLISISSILASWPKA